MAKKKEVDVRNIQIKFLVTKEESKLIEKYARRNFQSKSDFIRSSIRSKIDEFNRLTLPNKTDPKFKNSHHTKDVRRELKEMEKKISNGGDANKIIPLVKTSKDDMKRYSEEKENGNKNFSLN